MQIRSLFWHVCLPLWYNTPMEYKTPAYLDCAASTPCAPEVTQAMLPWLSGLASAGNPSSIHQIGRAARAALDEARDKTARLIHADYSEITFTSSGTEADNLAIFGVMRAAGPTRRHLVTTAIEHHAVLHCAHQLQREGYEVTLIQPDSQGRIAPEAVAEAVTSHTALVSVMHANNEIGTLQEIEEIARIAHGSGALFHTDAVQTAPVLPLNVRTLQCDLLSFCSHKMYGPRGAAALYARPGTAIAPQLVGGAQERERRAGTENVAALAGFGCAAELAAQRQASDAAFIAALRDALHARLAQAVPILSLNGHPQFRLPGILNVYVPEREGATLLMRLDRLGVCASSGSACSSGSLEPSHVLQAIGQPPERARSGIRFSLGRYTTIEEVEYAADKFAEAVSAMQGK